MKKLVRRFQRPAIPTGQHRLTSTHKEVTLLLFRLRALVKLSAGVVRVRSGSQSLRWSSAGAVWNISVAGSGVYDQPRRFNPHHLTFASWVLQSYHRDRECLCLE